jgi:hypothetical protein
LSDTTVTLLPEQFINISNPDEPIYRIFKLWPLEQALRQKTNRLSRPEKWEDPNEFGIGAIAVNRVTKEGRFEQIIITNGLPPSYAQCWSATKESDTLLRAYSSVVKHPYFRRNITPADEGVRVQSTPRKLLSYLQQSVTAGQLPKGSCYIGAVRYTDKIPGEVAWGVTNIGIDLFKHPRNRAERLLMKREAFAHEAEIRLLYLPDEDHTSRDNLDFSININEVFEEIAFDPRLEYDRHEREATFRRLGYEGPFGESDLYQRVEWIIPLDEREKGSKESVADAARDAAVESPEG